MPATANLNCPQNVAANREIPEGWAAAVTGRIGSPDPLLYAGLALLGVGLLFKVGAVPFHSWTPDVYQGAPTPVTGFMAACTKVAAFGAILRVLYVGFSTSSPTGPVASSMGRSARSRFHAAICPS